MGAKEVPLRITKVYTKVGDQGSTRLVGGREVSKGETRIEAYGSVDELNAVVGLARTFNVVDGKNPKAGLRIETTLKTVQNDLFRVGADLATLPEDRWEGMERPNEQDIQQLEDWIDELNDDLPPLKEFILPGGGPVGADVPRERRRLHDVPRALMDGGEAEFLM